MSALPGPLLGVANTQHYYGNGANRLVKLSGFQITSSDYYLIYVFGEANGNANVFCLSGGHTSINVGKVFGDGTGWEFYKDNSGNYYVKVNAWGQANISVYQSTRKITTEMITYDTTDLTPITVL